MAFLVGMDEAGYGPNYGPLVVAATAWEVSDCGLPIADCGLPNSTRNPQFALRNGAMRERAASSAVAESQDVDLYRLLRSLVARSPSERRLAIADSKRLYKPGLGLRQLERGVHAVLQTAGKNTHCWHALVDACAADPLGHHKQLPWHVGFHCDVPIDADADEVARLSARMERACAAAGVRPLVIRARYIFPAQFNTLVELYGSKGAALSHVTVGLLRETLDALPHPLPPAPAAQPPISVVCDKHGGRNYYAALLQHHFSEFWIEPVRESGHESVYEWGPEDSRVRAAFRVGGEAFLPTALASMTAKYLRELAMRAFNEFWCARVPNLKPTAGYPLDSRRFRRAIAAVQRELNIDDHILWRNR